MRQNPVGVRTASRKRGNCDASPSASLADFVLTQWRLLDCRLPLFRLFHTSCSVRSSRICSHQLLDLSLVYGGRGARRVDARAVAWTTGEERGQQPRRKLRRQKMHNRRRTDDANGVRDRKNNAAPALKCTCTTAAARAAAAAEHRDAHIQQIARRQLEQARRTPRCGARRERYRR